MSFSLFISKRYLLAPRKQTFISVISIISVLGVMIGVGSLIITLGIMNGFTTDLRDKILGSDAHAVLLPYGHLMSDNKALEAAVAGVPGVSAVTPFIYSEVMVSSGGGAKGLKLRGIDPATVRSVLKLLRSLPAESVNALKERPDADFPGIIIGKELADMLRVKVGDAINLLSPTGQRGAAGFTSRVLTFEVVGIFASGMFDVDSSMGFISLDEARGLLGMPAGMITGLEISVDDVYQADIIAREVVKVVGGEYFARDWKETNVSLFAALKMEKMGMSIVLCMIVLVAAFSIVTTLVMLVMEKTKDIAILMSMGATRKAIRNIFMIQGVIIGTIGTTLGFALGVPLALLITKYKLIDLPKGVYSMDHVIVLLQTPDLICIGVGAMLVCFLATLYPAYQASGLAPSEALRYE